jgi:hypothetical protein
MWTPCVFSWENSQPLIYAYQGEIQLDKAKVLENTGKFQKILEDSIQPGKRAYIMEKPVFRMGWQP